MFGRNGFRGLVVMLFVLLAASAWSVAAAAQAQATPQPTQQVQPTARPTQQTQATPQTNQATEQQPYLGVRLEDTTDGVAVREVMADSPAATAGVQPSDIIKKINDTAVANVSEVATALHDLRPNAQIMLDITRAGHDMKLTATLGAMSTTMTTILPTDQPFDAFAYNGSDKSWQVFSLAEASPLHSAGLRAGDIITKFNDTAYDPAALRTFRDGLASDATVKITVQRNGSSRDVNVPASDFKALRLFGYENEGLLFNMPGQNGVAPSVAALPDQLPFDAFGYMSADKSWQVFGLAEDSALYQAGLRAGDRITKFNNTAYDPAALRTFRAGLADNETVSVTVARGDQTMNFDVPAADLNVLDLFGYETNGMLFGAPVSNAPVWLGAEIMPITQSVAQQRHLTVNQGALVQGVMPNSPAASAGLQPNDIITGIGNEQVDAQHTLPSLLSSHKPGDHITLNVTRGSQQMHIDATLAHPEISGQLPSLMGAF